MGFGIGLGLRVRRRARVRVRARVKGRLQLAEQLRLCPGAAAVLLAKQLLEPLGSVL